jgi:putative oxidoreductase
VGDAWKALVVNRATFDEHLIGYSIVGPGPFVSILSKELPVKIVGTIARYLLGLIFLFFGSNLLFHFLPNPPMPAGLAGQFTVALIAARYFYVVGTIMVISAILLLANRYVGLGLTLLGPVLFNILTYHLLMDPTGIGLGAFATLLWLLVAWEHRVVFARLFAARLEE